MAPVSEQDSRSLSREEVEKATINAWMLEYAASEIWNEFEKDRRAGANTRDYLQGLLEKSIRDNHQDRFNSLLVYFLCTLDGGGSDVELEGRFTSLGGEGGGDSEDEEHQPTLVTALENAFCIFQLIRKELNEQGPDGDLLALELREQAILTCCRLDQFDMALRVYEASLEFVPFMKSDKSARKRIRHIIKSRNSSHAYLDKRPYSKLLDMVADYLHPKCQDLNEPFLCKIARKVLDKECSPELEEDWQNALESTSGSRDLVITGTMFAKLVEHWGFEDEPEKWQEVFPALEEKRRQLSARKKELIRSMPDIVSRHVNVEELLAAAEAENTADDNRDDGHDDDNFLPPPPPPPLRPTTRNPKRRSAQRALTAVMADDNDRSASDLEQEPSTTVTSKNLPSVETSRYFQLPTTSSRKRDWDTSSVMSSVTGAKRRRPWSMQEEVALCRAVKNYGIGNWAAIKNNCHDFPLRTNVDLKDKWRSLVKSGRAGDFE